MEMQSRNQEDIRRDALLVATKKLAEGCEGCAEGYFSLAREYGATDEEIEQARSIGLKTQPTKELTRKDFLKSAAATIGTAALSSIVATNLVKAVPAHAQQVSTKPVANMVEGAPLQSLVDAAFLNKNVHSFRQQIERAGYKFSLYHSRGFIHSNNGVQLLYLIFAKEGTLDFGQIIWVRSAQVGERVHGELVHYSEHPDPKETDVNKILKHVKVSSLTLPNKGVRANMSCDYWTCWIQIVFPCCGPGIVACLWAGPFWAACAGSVCATCILTTDWVCITCFF